MSISRRKILIGAAGICASHAYAQVPLTGAGKSAPAGSSLDPATSAWIAAVVGAGGTVSGGRATLVNNLILGLKTDSIFTKLDRLWLHAAENTQSALIDIIAASAATAVNSPTFTTDQGYTFNGTTNYLNSNFNPNTGPAYTLNSMHLSSYMRTTSVNNCPLLAVFDGANFSQMTDANQIVLLANDASSFFSGIDPLSGYAIGTRTASNARAVYKNGSFVNNDTGASAAIPVGLNFFIGARNNGGSPDLFSDLQHAASSIGGGLDATNAANLTTRVNTYMTAIGANVF